MMRIPVVLFAGSGGALLPAPAAAPPYHPKSLFRSDGHVIWVCLGIVRWFRVVGTLVLWTALWIVLVVVL